MTSVCHPFILIGTILLPDDCSDVYHQLEYVFIVFSNYTLNIYTDLIYTYLIYIYLILKISKYIAYSLLKLFHLQDEKYIEKYM